MPKKKPRKRRNSSQALPSAFVRRFGVALVTAGVVALQTTSCSFPSINTEPSSQHTRAAPSSPPSSAASRFADCPQFFAGGVSPAASGIPLSRELCYEGFAVLHNGNTHTPAFVAERLNREILLQARGQKRTNRFFADARLPEAERAELSDYKGSSYAKGHMAPAGDMASPSAMAQSFTLANMVPQNPTQNSGSWAKIEEDTRSYVMRAKGNVYVITGPVFSSASSTIGANQVHVPTHLFKLVYDATTQRAWAHWQQNAAEARPGPPISYGELEQRTGIEWLPGTAIK